MKPFGLIDRFSQVSNQCVAFHTSLAVNAPTKIDRRGAIATTLAQQKPTMYIIGNRAREQQQPAYRPLQADRSGYN